MSKKIKNADILDEEKTPSEEDLPEILPTILLSDFVPFPGSVIPVILEKEERREAILDARGSHRHLLLINHRLPPKEGEKSPLDTTMGDKDAAHLFDSASMGFSRFSSAMMSSTPFEEILENELETKSKGSTASDSASDEQPDQSGLDTFAPIGVVCKMIKVFPLNEDHASALVQVLRRARPVELVKEASYATIRVEYPKESLKENRKSTALYRQIRTNLEKFMQVHPHINDELKIAALSMETPAKICDFAANHLSRDFAERQKLLFELDIKNRAHMVLEIVIRELDLLTLGNKISMEIREKVEGHQRDFFLREQLKSIRVELGEETDPAQLAYKDLARRLGELDLPEHVKERTDEQMSRLQLLPLESPEHNIIRSYIEWIVALPWSKLSEERDDIEEARQILDEDHYGLEEVKDRIIEFLAVRQKNPDNKGTMLCFSGPPGVGKTSLGQSIARALGRKFYRFSVGGMRDEAEIKGHRRTYVGAMPGRILQALKQVQVANPVFMLDELDKMGSDWRGDPSSAMLEVLDPAQNVGFLDHYLDLPFDLSRVMFIATANVKSEIPRALLDRLEVIDLAGYIPEEKLEIGRNYLVPRQREVHGLKASELRLGPPTLKRVIAEYTHEAGVRELDRQVAKICRKRVTEIVSNGKFKSSVTAADVPYYLGPPKILDDRINRRPPAGIAIGLAWTPSGGDVLFIEAVTMPGKGGMRVTGHLGEVMSESAALSLSFVRNRAADFGLSDEVFKHLDVHLHFPAGAVRKDGPSAGVTVTTALISLLCGTPIKARVAMTGEMTLRGEVLPVGGVREKVVAARRAGIRTVILPERNKADLEKIPESVLEKIDFIFASTYDDVLLAAFGGAMPFCKKDSPSAKVARMVKQKKEERGRKHTKPRLKSETR